MFLCRSSQQNTSVQFHWDAAVSQQDRARYKIKVRTGEPAQQFHHSFFLIIHPQSDIAEKWKLWRLNATNAPRRLWGLFFYAVVPAQMWILRAKLCQELDTDVCTPHPSPALAGEKSFRVNNDPTDRETQCSSKQASKQTSRKGPSFGSCVTQ